LVDVHDGPAAGVMAGNDASYLQCHVWPPGSAAAPRRQMVTSVGDRVVAPAAVPVPACTGFGTTRVPTPCPRLDTRARARNGILADTFASQEQRPAGAKIVDNKTPIDSGAAPQEPSGADATA